MTRSKKRTIDETLPKAGEPYTIIPRRYRDIIFATGISRSKKRLVLENKENTKLSVEEETIPEGQPQVQGWGKNSKMAAPIDVNNKTAPSYPDSSKSTMIHDPKAVIDTNNNNIDVQGDDKTIPTRGRTTAKRGRPRKRPLSLEPIVDKKDLMSAIMRIRCDIGTVSKNQDQLKGEMIKSLDVKINELKHKLCEEVRKTKTRVHDNETIIGSLKSDQERLNYKVSDLTSRQEDIENDLLSQKHYIDDINLALSDKMEQSN